MKGIIELKVEVNYDEVINNGGLNAIADMLGLNSIEEARQWHLQYIADELAKIVRDMPNVAYAMDGQFVAQQEPIEFMESDLATPCEKAEPTPDDLVTQEDIEWMNRVEAESKTSVESVDNGLVPYHGLPPVAEEPVAEKIDPVELLLEGIMKVSTEKGIIKSIVMNDIIREQLETEGYKGLDRFCGYDCSVEGMEELFIIEFESSITGERDYFYSKVKASEI